MEPRSSRFPTCRFPTCPVVREHTADGVCEPSSKGHGPQGQIQQHVLGCLTAQDAGPRRVACPGRGCMDIGDRESLLLCMVSDGGGRPAALSKPSGPGAVQETACGSLRHLLEMQPEAVPTLRWWSVPECS